MSRLISSQIIRITSKRISIALLGFGLSFAAQANDNVLSDSARDNNTGQSWYNYLTQCTDCEARDEALGQLQLLQYLANGDMAIDGAATGTHGAADDALLTAARDSNVAQDWYLYLSQCDSCEARGEALGAMQTLQLEANGELTLDTASQLNDTANSSELVQSGIEANTGDENTLLDAALTNGGAIEWYSYLVGCNDCNERDDALNAMQQLQYASNGDAFNQNVNWVPGETLIAETTTDATSEANEHLTGDNVATEETLSEEASADSSNDAATEVTDNSESFDDAVAEIDEISDASTEEDAEITGALADVEEASANEIVETNNSTEPQITAVADWNASESDNWELALEISGHSRAVWRVAFSPVAPLLASASGDQSVLLYDLNNRDIKHRLTGHQGYVNAIAFSPDGSLLASGGGDRAVILWDVASGAAQRVLQGHNGDINAIAWSSTGNLLATGSDDGRVIVWNSSNGQRITELAETGSDVTAVAIAPNEDTVATAGSDGFVYLFNSQTGEQTDRLSSHDGYTFDLAWSVDGNTLSAAGSDGAIRQWQQGNNAKLVAQQNQALTGIDVSANGKYIASSSFDGNVVVRDANNHSIVQTIEAYPGSAYSVSMTGDGRFVAAAGGVNFIRVWRR